MDHTYAVIMAGGGGTRLWPISRNKLPKHLLQLVGEQTLFRGTLDRIVDFIPLEHIFVVTTVEQEQELKNQAQQLPISNFIIEPLPRGTASVVGLAATVLAERDSEALMIVLPADHFIRNRELFHQVMHHAVEVARKDYLVTIGIPPTFPATGYGYIQRGASLKEKYAFPAYQVLHFIEKPDDEKANTLLEHDDHYWNSGIFIWKVDRILKEFDRQMPDLKIILNSIGAALGTSKKDMILRSAWPRLKPETVDYGIMEHAANIVVLPADGLGWSDVGSWDSFFNIIIQDKVGNIVINSNHIPLETHNSLVYSSEKKLIVTIGVDDLIIIDSGDALLVCRRDQAQQVRQVISILKKKQQEEYL